MQKLNPIGLDIEKSKELAARLNELLANYSIFYQNTRGYHWNIKGDKFFELHQKFQDLYNDLLVKIDDVAERILTLGAIPDHRYSNYVNSAAIKESQQVADGYKAVEEILQAFRVLLTQQREILAIASEIDDEGTGALMSDYIRQQEKFVWMYSAFLNRTK
jgi:starvation-inducible DNA-binding protein